MYDVIILHGRIKDIGATVGKEPTGIMCAARGYTGGAKKYADAYGIRLNDVADSANYIIVFPKDGNVINALVGDGLNVCESLTQTMVTERDR